MKLCSVEGCGRPFKARGLCMRHYQRQWHHVAPGKTERLARSRAWKSAHPDKRNDHAYEVRQRAELSDRYIREVLRNQGGGRDGHDRRSLPASQIPPALIEAKRVQLQIHRLLRSMSWR